VILVDKESRKDCTGELSLSISAGIRKLLRHSAVELTVVLKIAKFENWLVSDPAVFFKLPGLFCTPERIEKRVVPGKADTVDASKLLQGCSRLRHFEKVSHAVAICRLLDPAAAARNSPSFARLLRVLDSPQAAEPSSAQGRDPQRHPRRSRSHQ
jgi:hypothetical protein